MLGATGSSCGVVESNEHVRLQNEQFHKRHVVARFCLSIGSISGSQDGAGWWVCWAAEGPRAQRRMAYRDYVEEAMREGLEASPWEQLVGRVVLGSQEFVARMQRVVSGNGREQPQFKE